MEAQSLFGNALVEQLLEAETTLLGTARLAAGWPPFAAPATREIAPSSAGAYLPEKYPRWREWSGPILAA